MKFKDFGTERKAIINNGRPGLEISFKGGEQKVYMTTSDSHTMNNFKSPPAEG